MTAVMWKESLSVLWAANKKEQLYKIQLSLDEVTDTSVCYVVFIITCFYSLISHLIYDHRWLSQDEKWSFKLTHFKQDLKVVCLSLPHRIILFWNLRGGGWGGPRLSILNINLLTHSLFLSSLSPSSLSLTYYLIILSTDAALRTLSVAVSVNRCMLGLQSQLSWIDLCVPNNKCWIHKENIVLWKWIINEALVWIEISTSDSLKPMNSSSCCCL